MQIPDFFNSIFHDRFRFGLLVLLLIIFIQQMFFAYDTQPPHQSNLALDKASLHIFYHPECPHCRDAITFTENLQEKYPQLKVELHNIEQQYELDLFTNYSLQQGISLLELGTPLIVAEPHHMVGYDSDENSGAAMEEWAAELLSQKFTGSEAPLQPDTKTLEVPLLGSINLYETSLPVLAIILGLVDGFNPCAMWVLVYLISLIAGIHDRRKVLVLIGAFLLASGILYFLFMTAWLNAFLLLGYIRIVTVLIGMAALYMGINTVRDYILSGGQVVCEVGDIQSRAETQSKIRTLIAAPLSLISFAGIVGLAFAVNAIEFVCSAALPAIFTHVLTVADLPTLSYYLYIALYVFVFMLDDLVIFLAAAFALERFAGEKYAGYCHVFGGIILICLGILLTFFPQALR